MSVLAAMAALAAAPASAAAPSQWDAQAVERLSDEVWKASGPFGLFVEDEVDHRSDRMNVDPTSWEDLGFYTILRSGDTELYLASIMMFSQGKPQTVFMASRDKRGDPDKISTSAEFFRGASADPIEVAKAGKHVVWKSSNIETIAAPPVWRQVGDFVDKASGKKIEFDLLFKQMDQEYWTSWPSYNPGRTGKGVHAPMKVEGVITVGGTRYVVDEGFSTYERTVMPTRHSPAMGKQDWVNALCGDKMNFMMFENGAGATQGFLNTGAGKDKKHYSFGDVSVTPTDKWRDPKLGRDVPSAWRITASSVRGKFDAQVKTYNPILLGKASDPTGFDIYHHMVSVNARFTPADGSAPIQAACYGTNEARFPAPASTAAKP